MSVFEVEKAAGFGSLGRFNDIFKKQYNLLPYEALSSMNNIKHDLCILGIRLPGCFDVFEMAKRAVIGQQISVKAANTLASRIVNTYGASIETGIEDLTHVFPSVEDILTLNGIIEDHFGVLGVTSIRAKTIYELAHLISEKVIDFDLCIQVEEEIKKINGDSWYW